VTAAEETYATQLMRLAQTGDEAAYAEVLALLTTATQRFARGRAGSVAWVDDVVQETLVSVHKARHTWDPSRPLAPWFYAIASHRLVDVWRRERRVSTREQGRDELEMAAPTEVAGQWDEVDMTAVRAALAALPPRQRDIVEGLKLRDDTVRGLAAKHQMSESAVKVMAHRGYRRLRQVLGGGKEQT
jgi:RNA polymerase sigma-70 factor (ECF subfamily)